MAVQSMPGRRATLSVTLVLLSALMIGACATKPPASQPLARQAYEQANDPFEPLNRGIFTFNDTVDGLVMEPVARGYRYIVPSPARRGIRNALNNLTMPWSFANALLQGDPGRAGSALLRFVINATVGIGGLFDPATDMGIDYVDEDLGQTLAVWGMGEGFYVVLPFLGPSSLRDSIGLAGEFVGDPAGIAADQANVKGLQAGYLGIRLIDAREELLDPYEQLMDESDDPYIAFRSVRRQNRAFKINNGRVEESSGDDLFEEDFEDFENFEDDDASADSPPRLDTQRTLP